MIIISLIIALLLTTLVAPLADNTPEEIAAAEIEHIVPVAPAAEE